MRGQKVDKQRLCLEGFTSVWRRSSNINPNSRLPRLMLLSLPVNHGKPSATTTFDRSPPFEAAWYGCGSIKLD